MNTISATLICVSLGGSILVMFYIYFAWRIKKQIFTVEDVLPSETVVVFGAKVDRNNQLSTMLIDRVRTGVELCKAGKARMLLMTGGQKKGINEALSMRSYAILHGIRPSNIIVDDQSSRTIASCFRLKSVHKINHAIIVTQGFHMPRIFLLCKIVGLNVVGVKADYLRIGGYQPASIAKNYLREFFAFAIAVIEVVFFVFRRFFGDIQNRNR